MIKVSSEFDDHSLSLLSSVRRLWRGGGERVPFLTTCFASLKRLESLRCHPRVSQNGEPAQKGSATRRSIGGPPPVSGVSAGGWFLRFLREYLIHTCGSIRAARVMIQREGLDGLVDRGRRCRGHPLPIAFLVRKKDSGSWCPIRTARV